MTQQDILETYSNNLTKLKDSKSIARLHSVYKEALEKFRKESSNKLVFEDRHYRETYKAFLFEINENVHIVDLEKRFCFYRVIKINKEIIYFYSKRTDLFCVFFK